MPTMPTETERWATLRDRMGFGLEDGEGPITIDEAEALADYLDEKFAEILLKLAVIDAGLTRHEAWLGLIR